MLKIVCVKGHNICFKMLGLLIEDSMAKAKSFDVAKTDDFVTKSKHHMLFLSFK